MCAAIKNFFNDKRNQFIFIVTFIWGIVAHGMILFQKLAVHDDVTILTRLPIPWTLKLGRWAGACMAAFESLIFSSPITSVKFNGWEKIIYGYPIISTPCIYGFLAFMYVALIVCLLADLFSIKDRVTLAALIGFTVTATYILELFGFMHGVPYYFPGIILIIASCFILCKRARSVRNFLAGAILLCLGTAFYQCFFPIGTTIMLLYILNSSEKENLSWAEYWKSAFYFLGCCIVSLVIYLVINATFIFAVSRYFPGFAMTEYANISSLGMTSISGYLHRIIEAYKSFILMPTAEFCVFPGGAKRIYHIILIISSIIILIQLAGLFRKSTRAAFQVLIAVIFMPFSVNLMHVMTESQSVHGLHTFPWVIAVLFILQRHEALPDISCKKFFRNAVIILVILSNVIMTRFDNACYVKLQIGQSEAIQYFTTLITRIKSLKNYDDAMPVVYLNENNKQDKTLPNMPTFDDLTPIRTASLASAKVLINDYAWKNFVKVWCGYEPVSLEEEQEQIFIQEHDTQNMPSYPDDGSINIIDGVVVVKF